MAETLTAFFQGLGLSNEVVIFIISMLPVVELRGGIIMAAVLGMKSVSYTHLDVYKRQVYHGFREVVWNVLASPYFYSLINSYRGGHIIIPAGNIYRSACFL